MISVRLQDIRPIYKNQSYFYILAMNNENQIKKTNSFRIASKRIKCLEVI